MGLHKVSIGRRREASERAGAYDVQPSTMNGALKPQEKSSVMSGTASACS